MAEHSLQGGCSCGRNQYEITLPPASQVRGAAQVVFGDTRDIRQAFATALPTLLKIPLPWLQSTTYAFFDDERPSDIRRVFTPLSAPHTKRNFCGFCGTSLSFWTESPRDQADYICLNLGSLERHSVNLLDALGVLPKAGDDGEDDDASFDTSAAAEQRGTAQDAAQSQPDVLATGHRDRVLRGQAWFEELIESGPLGRLKRVRGGHTAADGSPMVEWEVVEVDEADDESETPSKRRITVEGDVPMSAD